jgi:hypothetical protein
MSIDTAVSKSVVVNASTVDTSTIHINNNVINESHSDKTTVLESDQQIDSFVYNLSKNIKQNFLDTLISHADVAIKVSYD